MTYLGGKRGGTPRSSEQRERRAFASKCAMGRISKCLNHLTEDVCVEFTLSKPDFRSYRPQRKSPFSGEYNRNGIRLL